MADSLFNYSTLRVVLQQELLQRCRKNSNYSLRAFAKFLEISPSSLSRILRGERRMAANLQYKMGKILGYSEEIIEGMIQHQSQIDKADFSAIQENKDEVSFRLLADDLFILISDWYHYAILELVNLDDFNGEPQWIAKQLGLSKIEAKTAIERLVRTGLLKRIENLQGKTSWISLDNTNWPKFPWGSVPNLSLAHRQLQEQLLYKAIEALSKFDLTKRDQSSLTMAIAEADFPEIEKKITQFRRSLAKLLDPKKPKNAVYQILISFFPLSQPNSCKNIEVKKVEN